MSEHSTQTRLGSSYMGPGVRSRIYVFLSIYMEAGLSAEQGILDLRTQTSRDNALPAEVSLRSLLARIWTEIEAGKDYGQALIAGFDSVSPEENVILGVLCSVPLAAQARMLERLGELTAASAVRPAR
jgi:hypothetical protein